MTVEEMAAEINVDAGNLKMWLDLVKVEMDGGASLEDAVEHIQRFFVSLAAELQKPVELRSPAFQVWYRKLSDDVYDTIRAQK